MRQVLFAAALAVGPSLAWAQTTPAPAPVPPETAAATGVAQLVAPDERARAIRAGFTKYEYRIPMRDGTRLFTAVYVPNDASADKTYPILMRRTPYSVAPYGLDRYPAALGTTEAYEKEGFIFVFQDVRGQHMSEGAFVNMRPHQDNKRGQAFDEASDTHDTIDWLLAHVAHHNGRVGLMGISYPGFYASAGAIDSHPALKAVSPQAPIADWWMGDDMHRNGAFNLQMNFAFFSGFDRPRPEPTDSEEPFRFDYGTPDAYDFFLRLGGLSNANPRYFKNEIPFWNEVAAHPDYDAFWQSRNLLPHLRGVRAAMLVVGGFYDTEDLYGPLNTYRAIEKQNPGIRNTLVMGPWSHGGWVRTPGDKLGDADFGFAASEFYQPLELAFFKHHLKDGPDPRLPEALMFESGANRWRRFDAWPPREAQPRRLYLGAQGQLAFAAPTAETPSFDEYVSDPAKPVPYTQEISQRWGKNYMAEDQRFVARRPDVLVFQTEPLSEDLTLAGPIEVELWASSSGTDSDFVVKLIDVNPDMMRGWTELDARAGKRDRGGQQTLVRGEPIRARYRDDPAQPRPLVPNEPTRLRVTLDDVLHTFQRGHRVMIQVQSTWFPFIDRNPQQFVPNIYQAKDSDFVRATQRVYHDAAHASAVTLPVLPKADE